MTDDVLASAKAKLLQQMQSIWTTEAGKLGIEASEAEIANATGIVLNEDEIEAVMRDQGSLDWAQKAGLGIVLENIGETTDDPKARELFESLAGALVGAARHRIAAEVMEANGGQPPR